MEEKKELTEQEKEELRRQRDEEIEAWKKEYLYDDDIINVDGFLAAVFHF